jgi:hypothetical protein
MKKTFNTVRHLMVKQRTTYAQAILAIDAMMPTLEKLEALELPGEYVDLSAFGQFAGEEVVIDLNPTQKLLKLHEDYPRHGKKEDKIKNILTKQNRAMRITEIQDAISIIEGIEASAKTLKSFNYMLVVMQRNGEIFVGKRSNRYTFYALPNFLENGELMTVHYPIAEAWGSLQQSERNFKGVPWKGGPNS